MFVAGREVGDKGLELGTCRHIWAQTTTPGAPKTCAHGQGGDLEPKTVCGWWGGRAHAAGSGHVPSDGFWWPPLPQDP